MTEQQVIHSQATAKQDYPLRDDEIDLAELFGKAWQRKLWVVGITTLTAAIALAYVLLAKPTYKAELFLMPPAEADVAALNVNIRSVLDKNAVSRDQVYQSILNNAVSRDQVYQGFLQQLRSRRQLFSFFQQQGLVKEWGGEGASEQVAFEGFLNAFSVNAPTNGEVVFTSATLEGPSAQRVAELLNRYVGDSKAVYIARLVSDVTTKRNQAVSLQEKEIASKRALAEAKRQDRIAELEEAHQIAEAVGLKSLGTNAGGQTTENIINILNSEQLFYLGTRALRAEIIGLKNRSSDDPFIPDLRGLQENINNLKALNIDVGSVRPVAIDMDALVPERPIKPKKKLIMAAAIVLGGMLGLFIALVVPTRKEKGA